MDDSEDVKTKTDETEAEGGGSDNENDSISTAVVVEKGGGAGSAIKDGETEKTEAEAREVDNRDDDVSAVVTAVLDRNVNEDDCQTPDAKRARNASSLLALSTTHQDGSNMNDQHATLKRKYSKNYAIGNTNISIMAWFDRHRLPWNNTIANQLDDFGVDTLEDLKLLEKTERYELFGGEKIIVKRRAELAFAGLGDSTTFEFQQSSPGTPLGQADQSKNIETNNKEALLAANRRNSRLLASNFSPRELLMIKGVVRLWCVEGRQSIDCLRAIANALDVGVAQASLSREIRLQKYGPWDVLLRKNDKVFQRIKATVHRATSIVEKFDAGRK